MRLSSTMRLDLAIAAALAGLGVFSAVAGAPRARQGHARGSLAALRRELSDEPAPAEAARGRDAEWPSEIPARGWWDIVKRVFQQFGDHRIMTEAAGVTFYALLAMFPAIAALISIFGLVADPATISQHLDAAEGFVPGGGLDILRDEIKRLVSAGNGALGFGAIVGILVALWSANGGTKAMFDSLNIVYDEKEKRSYVRRTVISLAMTLGALVAVILALGSVVVLPIVLSFLGLSAVTDILIKLARWPVMMLVIGALLAVLYRYGPSRREAKWRWLSWGSGFAAATWVIASICFSFYVAHFGSYNKTYGSLGAAVGFMTWIWISAMVVLIGAEMDAEMEHQTARDSTVGPPKPLGLRGAVKADEVA